MPLVKGTSKQAIEENTKREIEAGKKPNQAYAIANAMARRLQEKPK